MSNSEHISKLLTHIEAKYQLTREDEVAISKVAIVKQLKKKECFIEPGRASEHMNFISKGCLRAFYLDEEGQEHTLQLGVEEWWINDLYGYITGKPSKMFVQALEESVIVQLPKTQLDDLYLSVPAISNFFRDKIQSAYVALQERTIENMSNDSFERYLAFRRQYRNIEQRVPQYIVASYLGITPEFLSHLRKKHAKDLS